jgi:hypothetical protein
MSVHPLPDRRQSAPKWDDLHNCDEDGEIPCSICGYVSGMYDDEPVDVCKYGGPAPCIDDICHGLGGCMGYEGDLG